ncbi:MAG: leucine-rich repeat domain-containing protein, partial [Limisphaerales bacterium]
MATHAQGTVTFANLGDGLNQPIYLSDWTTKVSGPGYTAELLAGTSAANLQSVATTGFLPSALGYFDGGVVTIPDIPAGSPAFFEIRVWSMASGPSYAAAQVANIPNTYGASSLFVVTLGGGNSPATLSTFQGLGLWGWPEPLQFYYTTNDDTITITGSTGARGAVTIPSTINGLPVTSIGNDAFSPCGNLPTSITIPDSVTNIGAFAFNGCTGLANVNLGNGVVSIGAWAFSYCTTLTSVSIPASVTHLGTFAFGSPNLVDITVSPLSTTYCSEDGVLFDKNQTTLVEFPVGKAGSYVIASTVTSIGDGAFLFCPNLTSVTMPDTVTNIGDFAFSNCAGLTNVTIANNVANIGSYAFLNCGSLTSALIPRSVTSIGDEAFGGCLGLKTIGVDASNPVYSSLDGVLLNKSQNTLLQYPAGKI